MKELLFELVLQSGGVAPEIVDPRRHVSLLCQ
jgi:hypothetical protein